MFDNFFNLIQKNKEKLLQSFDLNEKDYNVIVHSLKQTLKKEFETLKNCSDESLYNSMLDAFKVRLPFGDPYYLYLLTADREKKEAKVIISYKGMLLLASRKNLTVKSSTVHEKDQFSLELGDNPSLKHIPYLTGDRGEPTCYYATVKINDELLVEYETHTKMQELVKKNAKNDMSPWKRFPEAMIYKTLVKRLLKPLGVNDVLSKSDFELENHSEEVPHTE